MGGEAETMDIKAYEEQFEGEPAVWLKAGRFEAAVLPGTGGNLIAFRDTENGYRFLREPGEDGIEALNKAPEYTVFLCCSLLTGTLTANFLERASLSIAG